MAELLCDDSDQFTMMDRHISTLEQRLELLQLLVRPEWPSWFRSVNEIIDLETSIDYSPRLSYDILLLCFKFLAEKRDVSSFMMTCKTLFGPGIPHLLEPPIFFHAADKAHNFLRFMLSDFLGDVRFRSLHSMSVAFSESHTEPFRILVPRMTQVLASPRISRNSTWGC